MILGANNLLVSIIVLFLAILSIRNRRFNSPEEKAMYDSFGKNKAKKQNLRGTESRLKDVVYNTFAEEESRKNSFIQST